LQYQIPEVEKLMEIKKITNGFVSGYTTKQDEEESSSVFDAFQGAARLGREILSRFGIDTTPGVGIASAPTTFEDNSKPQNDASNLFDGRKQKVSINNRKDKIMWGNGEGSGI
jgi:hypothetical protein